MRLVPAESFASVLEPLATQRIGYIRPFGNVGDALIEVATFKLFDEFGIRWRLQDPNGPLDSSIDCLVFGGGGNMGTLYRDNWAMRRRVLAFGLPITILPQSFTSLEGMEYSRVFVRERESLAFYPEAKLAPDMALGLEWRQSANPRKNTGIFLRDDLEAAVPRQRRIQDPVAICRTPYDYMSLAANYRQIITDRLHFAICGLIAGREVVLLPNSYHKNRSMYETWLEGLGCKFARSVRQATRCLTTRSHYFGGWWRHAAQRGYRSLLRGAATLVG